MHSPRCHPSPRRQIESASATVLDLQDHGRRAANPFSCGPGSTQLRWEAWARAGQRSWSPAVRLECSKEKGSTWFC